MPYTTIQRRKHIRNKLLLAAFTTLLVLALSFCGWVYRAKTQHDLNMKLLGAVRSRDANVTHLLLAQGADPNIRDVEDKQPSLWQQIRQAFHKDCQPSDDQMNRVRRTMLEMAMSPDNENVPLIQALLEAGAHPDDSSDSDTITPLMIAVGRDFPQTVQMLLDHGANPLAKDYSGRLPIHFMESDDLDELKIAALLVKRENDVNAAYDSGRTALLNSCGYGNIHIVRFLLAHGARVDIRDANDDTPLLCCFRTISSPQIPDIVKLLIEHGADVNHRNKQRETALSLAIMWEDKQSVRQLEAAGAKR